MADNAPAMQLVVGLGNPGPKYEQTRHNAGFWFVDELDRRFFSGLKPETRFHGEAGRCNIDGRDCRVLKPLTYMNKSGQAVAALAGFFRIPAERILVVHDELDLPVGTVKLKRGGGHGGHNGLRDIIAHLGKDFLRLRVGIDHPGHKDQVIDYVLQKASRDDRISIDRALDAALEVMPLLVRGELEKAMHRLHSQ